MLLAARPRVLLLDEPMAGVSMEDVPELVELIRSVHADEGKTVLMVEHHMEVVTGLAQRIAVMHHGRLLAVDTPEAIMRTRRCGRRISEKSCDRAWARRSRWRSGRAGFAGAGADAAHLGSRPARPSRRVAHPAGHLVRRPRGRSHGSPRPERRRQDDDAASPDGPRRSSRHDRARRPRHPSGANAQDRRSAAWGTSPKTATSSRP